METIIYFMCISSLIILILMAILSTLFSRSNWKSQLPEYFGDKYFQEKIIPLGVKIENDYLAGKNLVDEARFISKNLIRDQKRFIWLWDYAIKNEYCGLQKILIDVFKMRFYFQDDFFRNEIFPLIQKIEDKIENNRNIEEESVRISNKIQARLENFVLIWDYSIDHKKDYLQNILIRISNIGTK